MKKDIISIPATTDPEPILENLRRRFHLKPDRSGTRSEEHYDTFDWSLQRRNRCLVRDEAELRLEARDEDRVDARVALGGREVLRFATDVPPGLLRDALVRWAGVRALLPLMRVHWRERLWRVLNRDEKTVVRVAVRELSLIKGKDFEPIMKGFVVLPLRGYKAEHRQLRAALAGSGVATNKGAVLDAALQRAGIAPGSYSSKISVELSPDLPAREAVCRILRRLLSTMRANENGIRTDIDTEFLHDFRVAIRRTRVALATLKKVFPRDPVASFARDFRALGDLSGPLRDLDVYLLREADYAALLPAELRVGLRPLFEALTARRRHAHRELVGHLESPAYDELVKRWEAFLEPTHQARLDASRRGHLPAGRLARRAIRKRVARILQRGNTIDAASPDKALHALRIDGKKLRYLLEFFASLYDAQALGKIVKQLKRLQDNLGDYNDLSVQIGDLQAVLVDTDDGPQAAVTAAALGGLMARLNERKQAVREQFHATFAGFAAEDTMALFAQLDLKA